MTIRDEVLAANEDYAASFGRKQIWPSRRPATSPSSRAWMHGSIRRNTPG